jgi:fimbrial chaperone protein
MTALRSFWALGALLVTAGLLGQSYAFAGQLRLAPVRVFLNQETSAAMIELSNPADKPVSIQADAFSWAQTTEGVDEYEPTTEILAFPPIFTIQPGETQLVRIGKLSPQSTERESAYRVYFTELSAPSGLDEQGVTLSMRLRIGVPVFAAPSIPRIHELRIVSSEYGADGLNIRLQNSGNTHVRISDLAVPELTGVEGVSMRKYILPGASQEFSIPVPNGSVVSTILAVSEQMGTTELDLETGLAIIPSNVEFASR